MSHYAVADKRRDALYETAICGCAATVLWSVWWHSDRILDDFTLNDFVVDNGTAKEKQLGENQARIIAPNA
jgi:hypothetical protein